MKMGIQDPHFPGRIGTRVPILPEKWGPRVPILRGPYFHVTPDLMRYGSIEAKQSIVVMLSPLLALMKDQVATYSAKGLSVGSITRDHT